MTTGMSASFFYKMSHDETTLHNFSLTL